MKELSQRRDTIWLSAVYFAAVLFVYGLLVQSNYMPGRARLEAQLLSAVWIAAIPTLFLWILSGREEALSSRVAPAPALQPSFKRDVLVTGILMALLAASLAAIAYGAWATETREWDGFVGWELRAKSLTPIPAWTEEHPLLAPLDAALFFPSLQYPLLLPSLSADLRSYGGPVGGRLASLMILVAWIQLFVGYANSLRLGMLRSALLIGAFGLTPMLYSTGAGGADSGYAEILMGYALTVCALGLALRFGPLLLLGPALLIWSKPEGLAYAALFLLVTTVATRGRWLHLWACLSVAVGLLLWLPLRAQLSFASDSRWWLGLALPLLALIAKEATLRWPVLRRRWRVLLAGAAALALAGAFVFAESLRSSSVLILRDFAGHPGRLFERLTLLPEILWGTLRQLTQFKSYGFAFVLLAALLAFPSLRRWCPRPRSALLFALLGLLLAFATLLLSPEDNIQHELRSRLDRLLLHWIGPLWVVLAPWIARAWAGCARLPTPGFSAPDGDPAQGGA
jgi:hypothetical protein